MNKQEKIQYWYEKLRERDVSFSSYRVYWYWAERKNDPQDAYNLAVASFSDNDEYMRLKNERSGKRS